MSSTDDLPSFHAWTKGIPGGSLESGLGVDPYRARNGTTPAMPAAWGDFDIAAPSSVFVASLVEIATALSRIPRFNGWGIRAYTVAEHSILCDELARADDVPARHRRAVLFHDAPEVYWGDDIRPKKTLVPTLQAFEDRIALAIAERFDIPVGFAVAPFDDLALAIEWRELFPGRAPLPGLPDPGIWQAPRLAPEAAALEFLRRAGALGIR